MFRWLLPSLGGSIMNFKIKTTDFGLGFSSQLWLPCFLIHETEIIIASIFRVVLTCIYSNYTTYISS